VGRKRKRQHWGAEGAEIRRDSELLCCLQFARIVHALGMMDVVVYQICPIPSGAGFSR
jgi:hypothetical protein